MHRNDKSLISATCVNTITTQIPQNNMIVCDLWLTSFICSHSVSFELPLLTMTVSTLQTLSPLLWYTRCYIHQDFLQL